MPGVFQLFLLKGTLWMHHFWERPFILLIAISASLGIVIAGDLLSKIRPLYGKAGIAILLTIVTIACVMGTNHYFSISHFSPAKVKLFSMLKERIPADKALLSSDRFIFDQHKAKEAGYRPEVAWYLDREILQARSLKEIEQLSKSVAGRYYLIPYHQQLVPLINQLRQRYKFESIAGDQGAPGKAPMMPYLIFDTKNRVKP